MNPAESTTSCAAVPAVRATLANPASTFRWRTTSCVLFGSERIQNMMDTLGIADDEPIDQKIPSGAIENAQKKIESRNFGVRKHVPRV